MDPGPFAPPAANPRKGLGPVPETVRQFSPDAASQPRATQPFNGSFATALEVVDLRKFGFSFGMTASVFFRKESIN